MIKFAHFNFNVLSIESSLVFYERALGLKVQRTIEKESFKIVYLGNDESDFVLELTELYDRKEKYDLGDEEFHLAFVTDAFDEYYKLHQEMGCICYENKDMGIYFIQDLDGYWIEIIPERKKS
ncbi:MAG: VOC family protein [Erysipelotrichaceae bacterium]